MSNVFITGDCHASYSKLSPAFFPEGQFLTKDDYVIVCGDFGFWDDSKRQAQVLDELDALPFTTLWVDGNHENFDLLYAMPVEEWHGGKVHFLRPSVIHLMRGQMFTLAGRRFFTFGGARSHDIWGGILEKDDPKLEQKAFRLDRNGEPYRINHVSWWTQEMPDEEEMEEGRRTLDAAGWKTDYIITHCCSSTLQEEAADDAFAPDPLTDYFSEIRERCDFGHWFFGHYHENADFSEKETCLYEEIVRLTEDGYKSCGLARRFTRFEKVRFYAIGRQGREQKTGTIASINIRGGGLYSGEQPTANIWTDDGYFHKDVPFEDIETLDFPEM